MKSKNDTFVETDYCLIGTKKDLTALKLLFETNNCCYDPDDFYYFKKQNKQEPLDVLIHKLCKSGLGNDLVVNDIFSFFIRNVQKSESGKFYTYCYSLTKTGNCVDIINRIALLKGLKIKKIIWRQFKSNEKGQKYELITNDKGLLWNEDGSDVYINENNPGQWL